MLLMLQICIFTNNFTRGEGQLFKKNTYIDFINNVSKT